MNSVAHHRNGRSSLTGSEGVVRPLRAFAVAQREQRIHFYRFARHAAFTLIELMVVILLIGILSAAILPVMRGSYEDALLRSTGRELMNLFELAHSRAVTLNQIHRVRIDEKSGRYLLEAQAQGPSSENEFASVPDVPGSEGALDSRIAISIRYGGPSEDSEQTQPAAPTTGMAAESSGLAFAFYADGTADAGEIRLQDRDGFRLALRLNPVTARVRILDLARE